MIDIGNEKMKMNCPKCNSSVEATLSQFAAQRMVSCRSCGQQFNLVDEGGKCKKAINDMKAASAKLDNLFKNFGR